MHHLTPAEFASVRNRILDGWADYLGHYLPPRWLAALDAMYELMDDLDLPPDDMPPFPRYLQKLNDPAEREKAPQLRRWLEAHNDLQARLRASTTIREFLTLWVQGETLIDELQGLL